MYYMEIQSSSELRWSSKGLLGLLRATLPPAEKVRVAPQTEAKPPPRRLTREELFILAEAWRQRSAEGDKGAESVAQTLEMLAVKRSQVKRTRIEEVGRRLSQLMQLS